MSKCQPQNPDDILLTDWCSASYLAFCMILQLQARTRLQQTEVSPTGQPPLKESGEEDCYLKTRTAQVYLSDMILLAHRSAHILQDFRERYGLKITPAWLLQLQAVASSVLMLDPDLTNPLVVASQNEAEHSSTIRTSAAAFEEVFRGLLGTGVQVMVARGIARMSLRAAVEHKVVLSQDTQNILQIMAETAWRPSDVRLVDSTFPNFATTKGYEDNGERMSQLLMKWEALGV